MCTNRSLRAGRRRRASPSATPVLCMHPPTHTPAKPFLVDVWVEDTHGRRKQRIMVITVIKRRPLRTRPGSSWKIRPFATARGNHDPSNDHRRFDALLFAPFQ